MSNSSFVEYVGLGCLSKMYFIRVIGKSVDCNNQSSYISTLMNLLKLFAFQWGKNSNDDSSSDFDKEVTRDAKIFLADWTDSRLFDDKGKFTDIANDYCSYYQNVLWGKSVVVPIPKSYSTDVNVRSHYKDMDLKDLSNYEWVNWSHFCYYWFHKYMDKGSSLYSANE